MVDEMPKPAPGQFWAKRDLTRGTILNYIVKRVVDEADLKGFAELLCLEHDTWALTDVDEEPRAAKAFDFVARIRRILQPREPGA